MSMSYQETQKLYFFRKEMRAKRRRRRLVVVVCDAVKHWYGFGWLFFQVCVLWWWWWLYYNFHAPWTLSGTFLLLPGCFNTSPWLHWFYWGALHGAWYHDSQSYDTKLSTPTFPPAKWRAYTDSIGSRTVMSWLASNRNKQQDHLSSFLSLSESGWNALPR